MIFFPKDIAGKVILLFCFIVIIFSVRYIRDQNKWSPIDEYAHMDYIDKLGEGRLPVLSDTISEELFQHIKNDSIKSVSGRVYFREQMGIGNYSYEAIHPPIYYTLLVVPNLILKKLNYPIFSRLKILRLLSYFLFVIGMFLCVPLFKALSKLGFDIPGFYAYGCILFGLLIATNHRYGLGNNMMSPLIVNATAIYLLKYLQFPSNKHLLIFLIFSGLSVFVAISNLFIIPFLLLIAFYKYIYNFSVRSFLYSVLAISSFIILFWYWKSSTVPEKTLNDNFQTILAMFIPAGLIDYKTFLKLFFEDAFRLSFINEHIELTWVLLSLFFINSLVVILFFKSVIANYKWVVVFWILFICFGGITFLLNKYVARVHWVAFRHYLGFITVLYVSVSFWILLLYSKVKKRILL